MPLTDPEIEAGTLDRRVSLLRPLYNQYQDEIVGWESFADVWAAVTPTFGLEQDASRRDVSNVAVTIVIRHRTDVDARCRVLDGPHLYEIEALLDAQRRRAQLQLACKEVL